MTLFVVRTMRDNAVLFIVSRFRSMSIEVHRGVKKDHNIELLLQGVEKNVS